MNWIRTLIQFLAATFNLMKKNIKESVNISQSEEERLLKIVQKELDGFMKKMYQTLYGQFARESNFLLNTMLYEQHFYDYLDRGGEKNVGT